MILNIRHACTASGGFDRKPCSGTNTTLTRNWNMTHRISLALLGLLVGGIMVAHGKGHLQFGEPGLASQMMVATAKSENSSRQMEQAARRATVANRFQTISPRLPVTAR